MVNRSKVEWWKRQMLAMCGLALVFSLAGCGAPEPEMEEAREDRNAQEKILVLKQRFEQLESSLDNMESDLKIQQKRVESTREVVESIRHSLTKGGLRGYSFDNVSTTDPVLLASIDEKRQQREREKAAEKAKDDTDDRILNGLLILCFLIIIGALFWMALNDRKTDEQPLEAGLGGAPLSPDVETPENTVDPYDPDITPGIDDTGSYQYGELGGTGPVKPDDPAMDDGDEDRPR